MIYEEDTSEREIAQFELHTFPMDIINVLDKPIDSLIESIKSKIKVNEKDYVKLEKKGKVEELKYQKLNKRRPYDDNIELGMFSLIEDNRYLEEELAALYEIKIVYAFKHLEINIKQLIGLAYPEEKVNRFYKWETLIQFFKAKNIELSSIKEYKDVNQLRILNNAIKHSSGILDNSITGLKEFSGKQYFYYEDIEKFYSRIHKQPIKFLTSLKNLIYEDLFSFPKNRIKQIAKSFRQRMTKEQASLLSEELLKYT